jgi:hypothetical protein
MKKKKARTRCLKPVILTTWEAKMRMIKIQDQPQQKVFET